MKEETTAEPLRVLIVEDNEDDAWLTVQELQRVNFAPAHRRVDTAESLSRALKDQDWDILIADYSLPQFSGLAAIEMVRDMQMDIPVILVSGAIGEETAVAAMRAGAQDYVMKGNMARLGSAVRREIEQACIRRERRAMEAKLRLAERMQLVGQLVLGVAHEIRNPLNCIMAVAEALTADIGQDPTYRQYIEYIREQVDRMAQLVTDLLDMGKPVDPARMHRDSLSDVCRAALALWRESKPRQTHNVSLIRPPGDEEIAVLADGARLQQVVINLLDNASQNSPEGSEIRLEIAPPDGRWVRFRVADQGCGIPPENLPKLFEPFFTTRKGGTGLGLCIVQRVVRDHGGELRLSNNDPAPGLTAEVYLPRPDVDDRDKRATP